MQGDYNLIINLFINKILLFSINNNLFVKKKKKNQINIHVYLLCYDLSLWRMTGNMYIRKIIKLNLVIYF